MAMIRWFGIASAVLWLAAFADEVSAAERRVPGDYPTIQAAIDAADPGDVILLADGEYRENIDYRQKPVTVTSTRSPDRCIFTGAIIMDEITGGTAVLRGITFTGYYGQHGPSDPPPCAFRIWRADAVVDNCRFVDNGYETFYWGGAGILCCIDSHATFMDCVFNDNEKTFVWFSLYGMFEFIQSTVTMVRCEFNDNIDSNVIDVQESDFSMDNCTLTGNFSKNSGGAMSLNHTTLRLTRSAFTDNRTHQFGGAIHMEDMLGAVIGGSAGNGNTFTGNTAYRGNDLVLLDQKEWRIDTRYNQFSGMPNF
nr:hypothetical protein [bacterium]